jgi:hypothetical protein
MLSVIITNLAGDETTFTEGQQHVKRIVLMYHGTTVNSVMIILDNDTSRTYYNHSFIITETKILPNPKP